MHFERPYILWTLFILIVPILLAVFGSPKIKKTTGFLFRTKEESAKRTKELQIKIHIRTICYTLGIVCIIFAAANPFWGSKTFATQKVGSSVSMVFDISWSMNASDISDINDENNFLNAELKSTRLEKAKEYAKNLIFDKNSIDQIPSISVVAAKGNGAILVPVTEDQNAILSAIENLSPLYMSSTGSNIGDGITKAISTFPATEARQGTILVFTDGEEIGGSIEKASIEALNRGINVFFIGFGSKEGCNIFVGEKNAKVHTYLREDEIKKLITTIKEKNSYKKIEFEYIDSTSTEDKNKILQAMYPTIKQDFEEYQQLSYEIKNLSHHNLFIFLAIVFFITGFVITKFKQNIFTSTGLFIFMILGSFFINSCTVGLGQTITLLQGSYFWHQGNFQKAQVKFLQSLNEAQDTDNQILAEYAIYGLGCSYAMQNEEIAAFQRLHSVSDKAPEHLKFSANYNLGVLSYSKGNYSQAKDYFKKALEINSKSIEAKINYELSFIQFQKELHKKKNLHNTRKNDSTDSILKNSIFSIIRENDQNIWKNQQTQQNSQDPLDY
ncbi:MAG: VWA domain-containing protein [Treponemataceae bacterium]